MEIVTKTPIVDQCIGCEHISGEVCHRYATPHTQWNRAGGCAMRTHNRSKQVESSGFLVQPKKVRRR